MSDLELKIQNLERKMNSSDDVEEINELAKAIERLERIKSERKEQEMEAQKTESTLDGAKANYRFALIGLVVSSVTAVASLGISAWSAKEVVRSRKEMMKVDPDLPVAGA